jgi:hypothetical protein
MAKARLIADVKSVDSDGSIIQYRVWKLPAANEERPHDYKYSFYFGRDRVRLTAYDNERGKGDHRHVLDKEEPYRFKSIEMLIADFFRDIDKYRSENDG